ncbi:hypothetical protein [Mycobacterium sp.]|uniref:hypothetical protein n=1 Tax=Mycobacterium sp. TaxID=1785 RepID=UPI003BB0D900
MTRTDRRGRPLKAFLQAEIVRADVTIEQVRTACGLTRASYYGEPSGTGRGFTDDFPNSEELRRVASYYELGDNGWVSLLVEFGWLDALPGTLRMPFTLASDQADQQFSTPSIGLVQVRDALSRYQRGSVLIVSADGDNVSLVPLTEALEKHPKASVIMFANGPASES